MNALGASSGFSKKFCCEMEEEEEATTTEEEVEDDDDDDDELEVSHLDSPMSDLSEDRAYVDEEDLSSRPTSSCLGDEISHGGSAVSNGEATTTSTTTGKKVPDQRATAVKQHLSFAIDKLLN